MLPIVWLAGARDDLAEIVRYIALDSPVAARRIKKMLELSILPAAEHPYLYRRSDRLSGCREVIAHPNYILFYRVTSSRIEVVNVAHARRNFP
jgi:toxin ParE1/3/4